MTSQPGGMRQAGNGGQAGRGEPGLAAERTRLAWSRTALAFAIVGGGMLRSSAIAGAVVIVLSLPVWSVGRLASGTLSSRTLARHFLLITALIVAVAATALAVAIFGHAPGSVDELFGRGGK
ncbi:MAG TPA: DUF202 domain-containing protein [Streptosporangiaceae bacterium]